MIMIIIRQWNNYVVHDHTSRVNKLETLERASAGTVDCRVLNSRGRVNA